MRNLLQAKRDASERQNARRLERLIVQFKSNQLDDDATKEQISVIEAEDPTLFEELSMRKKWSNVNKDPVKGLRDGYMNRNNYWGGMLNHLPSKGVDRIVTDQILKMDKESCENILQGILEEKQIDDLKRAQLQANRQHLRNKLSDRHKAIMELEIRSGVRLGMKGPDQRMSTQRRSNT